MASKKGLHIGDIESCNLKTTLQAKTNTISHPLKKIARIVQCFDSNGSYPILWRVPLSSNKSTIEIDSSEIVDVTINIIAW